MKDVSEMTRTHTFCWGGNSADERVFAGRFISSVHLALQRGLHFLVQTHGHVWKRLVFIFLVGVDQRHILAARQGHHGKQMMLRFVIVMITWRCWWHDGLPDLPTTVVYVFTIDCRERRIKFGSLAMTGASINPQLCHSPTHFISRPMSPAAWEGKKKQHPWRHNARRDSMLSMAQKPASQDRHSATPKSCHLYIEHRGVTG